MKQVAPAFFRMKQYSGFVRQLSHYSFTQSKHSQYPGDYFHPLFQRNRPDLCQFIKITTEPAEAGVEHTAIIVAAQRPVFSFASLFIPREAPNQVNPSPVTSTLANPISNVEEGALFDMWGDGLDYDATVDDDDTTDD